MSRRAIGILLVFSAALCWSLPIGKAETTSGNVVVLSPHVAVYRGATNVGIVRDGEKALLIDCGEGSVSRFLTPMGVSKVESLWFTHYHRDIACGAGEFVAMGAKVYVPTAERKLFDKVDTYWQAAKNRWHLYNQRPDHLVLAEAVMVEGELLDAKTVEWGSARITALATPGHTDGSFSFLVEADGKRIVFCGDTIYDAGKVWNLWSLQKGTSTTDYHGYLGARRQLEQSLGRLKDTRADVLIPCHGELMEKPSEAIDLVVRHLDAAYDNYVRISALRYYFPGMFTEYAGRKELMPMRPGKAVPKCLRHFGTTWMLISSDKSALVMDAGSEKGVARVQAMLTGGEIKQIEGLWVTHYHDDHVDAIPAFQTAFPQCPCITDRSVAEVIRSPLGWRLPCISPNSGRVDRATQDGETWQWHEFQLTAFHFPGQTLYHAGLFVEGQGLRMLFVGDSFTPAGIDDYCMQNRNWLGSEVGFDRCIRLIEKLRPTHIFNCHVGNAFDFTEAECRQMRANLAEREKLLGALVPWDHANYGTDDSWIRCYPYEQKAKPGESVAVDVVITNHSSQPRRATCRAILPRGWKGRGGEGQWPAGSARAETGWPAAEVSAKTEGCVRLTLPVPARAKPGRYVIPVDVQFGAWQLPQVAEAIVEL